MVNHKRRALDRTFQALADPTRRQMLRSLARGDARVHELARPHPISAPAISRHLRVLETAGLIKRVRRGREHWVELRTAPLRKAQEWLAFHERSFAPKLDELESLLLRRRGGPG